MNEINRNEKKKEKKEIKEKKLANFKFFLITCIINISFSIIIKIILSKYT